jgi:hypothetical protein
VVHNFESLRLSKDSQLLEVSLTISPVRDSRGRITGASTIARDISERKRTEDALLQKTLELERSNAELEDFTHVVSHDAPPAEPAPAHPQAPEGIPGTKSDG